MKTIKPCLWFDKQAEEAAQFYVDIFISGGKKAAMGAITRYGNAGHEIHGMPEGMVLTVDFELDGEQITALNGGPVFKFNEAISFQIMCDTQQQIDYFWERLTAGGDPNAQQCGWLKDQYGLSWQVVPAIMETLMDAGDQKIPNRVMNELLSMKKIDSAKLEKAYKQKEH